MSVQFCLQCGKIELVALIQCPNCGVPRTPKRHYKEQSQNDTIFFTFFLNTGLCILDHNNKKTVVARKTMHRNTVGFFILDR